MPRCVVFEVALNLGLKGRTALVTGASKGIGKAIARGLADEGVNLVLLARGVEDLERSAAEICAATGVRVVTVPTDMRETAAVKAAADRAAAEFKTVHILVNNAGGPIKRQERQITWPDTDWIDDVNIKTIGMLRMIQALLPVMPTDGTGQDRQHQRDRRFERSVVSVDAWAEQLSDESRDDLHGPGSVGVAHHRQLGDSRPYRDRMA